MDHFYYSNDIMTSTICEGEDEDLYGSSDTMLVRSWLPSDQPTTTPMNYYNFPSLERPNYGLCDNIVADLFCDSSPVWLPKSIIRVILEEFKLNNSMLVTLSSFTPVTEWRYFLSTSKILSEIKKDHVHFALNHHYSVQYYLNPAVKNKIIARVTSTSKQISLSLEERVWIAFDSTVTNRYMERINHVNSCNISVNPELEDISLLTDIEKLNCSNCFKLKNISQKLVVNSLKELNLSNCPAYENFEVFSNNKLSFFKISDNPFIQNISFLRGVTRVILINCPNIVDVSPLANNEQVIIQACEKVANFSTLVNVKAINISRNPQIRFLPAINHYRTQKISFDFCENLESLNELVETLVVKEKLFNPWTWNSDSEDDMSLESIRSLDLGGFGNAFNDFSSTIGMHGSSVKRISMIGCHSIKDLLCLTKLPSLKKVVFCRCIQNLVDPELKRQQIQFSVQNCGSNRKRRNCDPMVNQRRNFLGTTKNFSPRENFVRNVMQISNLSPGYDQSILFRSQDDEKKKFGRKHPIPDEKIYYMPDFFRNFSHLN